MKNYPYIGKCVNGIVVFSSKGVGAAIEKERGAWASTEKFKFLDGWDEFDFKNITHEYLSNTWGVVESKEHAEFIIELAELNGFDIGFANKNAMSFEFSGGSLNLYEVPSDVFAHNQESKQITIPLPPKAKEWIPEVGDEVLLTPNPSLEGKVLCKVSFIGLRHIVMVSKRGREYSRRLAKVIIEKPKTEQELKIEGLQTKLCNLNAVDNYILASEIIMGNVEGLIYE